MFSHLCRCCLTEFSISSEIVPLFERHKNILYHRLINATFRSSLTRDDNLGTNICKSCAIEILKSYKFRLKYMESDRKLRKMLDQAEEGPNRYETLFDVEVTVDESASILQENRWKCNTCTASFRSRSQYRDHRRLHLSAKIASKTVDSADQSSSNKNGQQKNWKYDHCSAELVTNKLKLKHERDHHSENGAFHEPAIVIEDSGDNDSVNDDFITPEINVNSVQNELRFIDQEPDLDLGLYLMEKHSQINNLDPLGVDNFSNSLLIPMNETSSSQDVEYTNDINNKWKCRLCAASFRTRDLLREHNHLHMSSKPRPKPEVIKIEKVKVKKSPKAKRAKQLMDNSVNVPKWQCMTCLLSFDTRELLRTHRREYFAKNEETGLKELQCIGEKQAVEGVSKKFKIGQPIANEAN